MYGNAVHLTMVRDDARIELPIVRLTDDALAASC
jgi:hypothetical protein